jgi:GNAT superfamily N-acetyltransferase
MKTSHSKPNFSVSFDAKHYLNAGIIRNSVLADEFNLHNIDFSTDQYDSDDNALYLLADGQCVGCCRVISRKECGRLPVEDYIELSDSFGLATRQRLNATCEFSRLAILPQYQGARGASLLIEAVAHYSLTRGLTNLIYCSNAKKMAVFGAIARRKDLHVQLDSQEFEYAGIEHAKFQAALVRLDLNADGEHHSIAKTG